MRFVAVLIALLSLTAAACADSSNAAAKVTVTAKGPAPEGSGKSLPEQLTAEGFRLQEEQIAEHAPTVEIWVKGDRLVTISDRTKRGDFLLDEISTSGTQPVERWSRVWCLPAHLLEHQLAHNLWEFEAHVERIAQGVSDELEKTGAHHELKIAPMTCRASPKK